MPNHKSAAKAHKQNVTRRDHHREQRSRVRRALRAVRAAIDSGDTTTAKETLRNTVPLLDKLVSKGVIHSNAAARYKSRLTRRLQTISAPA